MDKTVKLTGIARFSPRLMLLAYLSRCENPILSASATYMVRKVGARRLGFYYEFSFPVLLLIRFILPYQLANLALLLSCFVWSGLGAILLIMPGNALQQREPGGAGMKFMVVRPGEVFRALTAVQFASFVATPAFFIIADAIIKVYVLSPVTMDTLSGVLDTTYYMLLLLLTLTYLGFGSFYTGLEYKQLWQSLVGLVALLPVYAVILFLGIMALAWIDVLLGNPSLENTNPFASKYSLYGMILVSAVIANLLIAFLAYRNIIRRLKPER